MSFIDNFEKMLVEGRDNSLLRFTLGNEYLKAGDARRAIVHLRAAVEKDMGYSAAWKLLGKALAQAGEIASAREAYTIGIDRAEARGDKQAAKEMAVFLKRLR